MRNRAWWKYRYQKLWEQHGVQYTCLERVQRYGDGADCGRGKRRRRCLWVLLSSVLVLCCALVPSSVSALDNNTTSGWSQAFTSMQIWYNSSNRVCHDKMGANVLCQVKLTTSGWTQFHGLNLATNETFTRNDFVTFNISVLFNGVNNSEKFFGFNPGDNWTIESQEVSSVGPTSFTVFMKMRYMGTSPTKVVNLSRSGGHSLVIEQNSLNNTPFTVFASGYSVTHYTDAGWFENKLNSLDNKLGITNDLLTAIKNNGIKAIVDNSNVVNSVNNAANQAHKDSQANTEAINKGNEEEQQRWEQENQAGQDAVDKANGTEQSVDYDKGTNGLQLLLGFMQIKPGDKCTIGSIDVNGFDIGEIDLCAHEPPQYVKTLFAGIVTVAEAWCVFNMVRRAINLTIMGYS